MRRSSRSAAARSASASTQTRRSLPSGGSGPARRRLPSRPRRRSRALPLADRARRPGLRRGQAPARLLRAPRRPGLGGAGRGLRCGPRSRPADDRRRQAWRRPGHRRRLRAGAGRRDPDPVGSGRGARRRRVHRQPAARPRRAGAAGRGGGERRAGVFVLVRTSNPGAADIQDLTAPARRFTSASRRWSTRSPSGCRGRGLSGMGAVVGATEPAHIARLRELMPRSIFLIPGVGAQGVRRSAGRRFRGGPGLRLWSPHRAASPPIPTRPLPQSACGPPSGASRSREDARGGYTIPGAIRFFPPVLWKNAPAPQPGSSPRLPWWRGFVLIVVDRQLARRATPAAPLRATGPVTPRSRRSHVTQAQHLRGPERRHADRDRPPNRRLGRPIQR